MTTSTICMLLTIAAYLALMLYVGFRASKKNASSDDFYLGGRKLGPLVTAMSAEASDMSSWLLMGLPGVAYICGLADATWTAIGLAVGTYLNWLLVARRLRRYTERTESITLPAFFSNRYRDKSKLLLAISALIIVIFFVPYTASGFAACGKLFSSLFQVDYMVAMVISAAVIVTYCALGGFLAASTTDLIQSIVMTFALVVVLFFGIRQAGGFQMVIDNARQIPGYLSLVQSGNSATGEVSSYGAITILSTLAWGLGYFGMPHVLLRFMAIRDERELSRSRRIASVWVVISMGIAVLIGIIGYSMSKAGAIASFASKSEAEALIVKTAGLISSYGVFPAVVGGLILSGILACTMSTADSQLIAASSSIAQNLLAEVFGVKLSKKASMLIARLSVILIAVVGVFLAQDPNSSVFEIVSFAWAGFGAAFGPVVLFALFWKRSNRWGALAGMVSGGVMVFFWKYVVRPLGGAWNIYELLPAFLVACLMIVAVSLLTPAPAPEITEEFDAVAGKKK